MPRGLSDSNCHPRCAMPVLWVLLGGRSASPAFGNPEQHPGTARGRLGAGFAFLLDLTYLSLPPSKARWRCTQAFKIPIRCPLGDVLALDVSDGCPPPPGEVPVGSGLRESCLL